MAFITLFGSPKPKDSTITQKVQKAVSRTRNEFTGKIQELIEGKKEIDSNLLEDLETILIEADLGVPTTTEILNTIREKVSKYELQDPARLRDALKSELRRILEIEFTTSREVPEGHPFVILIVGVNGVGKTTTIGKLAHRLSSNGKKVLLCAADTFRAAAIEQLEIWATQAKVPIIKQKIGADPSAVLFDTLQSAKARKMDYVIVDTAGRLHTKRNLMAELEKMAKIAAREVQNAPHEVLLVLDATTGQNGLFQAREFAKTTDLTGLILTKLDGTAKGGVVTAIVKELKIPIRFVGIGEALNDLIEFSADDFVDSLFQVD